MPTSSTPVYYQPTGVENFMTGYGNPISAGISAGAGLFDAIGGLTGWWDTSSEKSAKKMAQLQLENQLKLMAQSNQYAVEQWNRQNEYNDPKNQIKRLMNAGLNPLFRDLDGNSAGGLTSATSPSAPDMGSLMNASGNTMRNAFERMQQSAQLALLNEQTRQAQIETKWYDKFKALEYDKLVSDKRNTDADTDVKIQDKNLREKQVTMTEYVLAREKATNDFMLVPKTFVDENGEEFEMTPFDYQMQNEVDTIAANLQDIQQTILTKKYDNDYLRKMQKTWEQEAIHRINMMKLDEEHKRALIGQCRAIIQNLVVEGKIAAFNLGQMYKYGDLMNQKKLSYAGWMNVQAKKGAVGMQNSNQSGIWTIDINRYNATSAHNSAIQSNYTTANQEINDGITTAKDATGIVADVISSGSKFSVPHMKKPKRTVRQNTVPLSEFVDDGQ